MPRRAVVQFVILLLVAAWPCAGGVLAQGREVTLQNIAKLKSGEREVRLADGAKKEGELIWYSSTTAEDSLALSQKFQERYPFVKVQHFRSPSEKLRERIVTEARAGSLKADVIVLGEIEMDTLIKRKLLARYDAPEGKIYPQEVKDPRGFWTGVYISAWVVAHNTKLVPAGAAPKGYKDLLNPRWKGAIAMEVEPLPWFITSLRYLEKRDGREAALDYFKKLQAQDLQWRQGHSLIGQLVSAGEFAIAAELQVHTVERLKAQGAPIDWIAPDGVIPINTVGIALSSAGKNTHTAALFYDFVISKAGMETIRERRRVPARPDVTAPYLKPYRLMPFDQQVMQEFERYVTLFRDTLKPRGN
ncbi:MAG: ABC transporter substrate-binding protein [Candidatus Binatia bacterium]